tara:strand:+ start:151 stop:537 length:387 start_codon:yes stop_codon:yes gene_type:complete
MIIHEINQEWAKDNFDIIDGIFKRLNKSETSQNKSYHKKQMAVDMDKLSYRAYYQLAKNEEKRKADKAKSIADRKRHAEDQAVRSMNDEMTARCIDLLKNQLLVKDKQIAFMKKMMESTVFSIEAETR